MKTIDISVILPIKSAITPSFDEYLENAINSVVAQRKQVKELIIVHTEEETLKNNSYPSFIFDFSLLLTSQNHSQNSHL